MTVESKPIFRLVLHPKNMSYAPESWDDIVMVLREEAFLGERYTVDEPGRYFIGDSFLQMITFMGCSPHIELEPLEQGGLDFCHVAFSEISSLAQFRHHERDVFARCPECGRRDQTWHDFINAWEQAPETTQYHCTKCETVSAAEDIRWRNSAGFACMFIDIYSVFPNEGVPTQQLLSLLKRVSGEEWNYFYTNC
ncbi:MAG: phage terminase large subunit family protein [Gammaproteobacteria bacterium]|nr:phage terminase large subunit family protein [Gammaproteobacteria bacterium]